MENRFGLPNGVFDQVGSAPGQSKPLASLYDTIVVAAQVHPSVVAHCRDLVKPYLIQWEIFAQEWVEAEVDVAR